MAAIIPVYHLSSLVYRYFCFPVLCLLLSGKTVIDERAQLKGRLHLIDPPPQLRIETYGRLAAGGGVTADRISFATDGNVRVAALVFHQSVKPHQRQPGIVLVPGRKTSKASPECYGKAIVLARNGAVVVTYDQLGQFERNHLRMTGTNQLNQVHTPELKSRLDGLMTRDVLQAVAYLRTRRDVDRRKVAVAPLAPDSLAAQQACLLDTQRDLCRPVPVDASVQKNSVMPILTALPEAQWSDRGSNYIFETWLDAAQSAIRSGAP